MQAAQQNRKTVSKSGANPHRSTNTEGEFEDKFANDMINHVLGQICKILKNTS